MQSAEFIMMQPIKFFISVITHTPQHHQSADFEKERRTESKAKVHFSSDFFLCVKWQTTSIFIFPNNSLENSFQKLMLFRLTTLAKWILYKTTED